MRGYVAMGGTSVIMFLPIIAGCIFLRVCAALKRDGHYENTLILLFSDHGYKLHRHKQYLYEGGIHMPLIVAGPGIKGGQVTQELVSSIDIVPTILEVAGTRPATTLDDQPVPPAPGHSLVNTFAKDTPIKRDYLWWSHDGHKALRVGDWKLVSAKGGAWELFDLADDRSETRDLAAEYSSKVKVMARMWKEREDEFLELVKK